MDLTQRRKGAKPESGDSHSLLCAFASLREALLILFVACSSVSAVHSAELVPPKAAEPRDDASLYTVETIASDLACPTSLAVRGGASAVAPFQLYVAEAGAARIVRLAAEKDAKATPVIVGFPKVDRGALLGGNVGPLSVAFLTANRLVVGDGGLGDGADLVRVYSLPDGSLPEGDAEMTFDQVDHSAGPIKASSRSQAGEGAFADLAGSDDACYVVPRSGDDRGWILKAIVDANRIAGLEPFVSVRDALGASHATAVTVDPRPNHHYLLIATAGEFGGELDSRVTMVSPTSGDVALALAPVLRDITAIAYSPAGDLYVADFAASDPQAGGVYRLEAAQVDGRESCRAVKIASAQRPTALAFTPDGVLYVTTLGDAGGATGSVIRIAPNDNTPKL
jgi:hypothetical protein